MLAQVGQLISPGKGLSEEEGGANGDSLKEQLRSLCSRRGSRVSESQRVTTGQAVCALLRRCQGGRWRRLRRRSVEKAEEEVGGEGRGRGRWRRPLMLKAPVSILSTGNKSNGGGGGGGVGDGTCVLFASQFVQC